MNLPPPPPLHQLPTPPPTTAISSTIKVSTWNYLNPFNIVDYVVYIYYSQANYGYGNIDKDRDLREIREEEGIPDLEDDTDKSLRVNYLSQDEITDDSDCFSEATSTK